MKTRTFTSFSATLLLFMIPATISFAQSKIKDGSVAGSSSLSDSNAILELESNSKGFLLPRVGLSNTTLAAPLSAHVAGITVYNKATAGDVTPGYYYNDGTKWVRIADATAADPSKDAWVDDNSNTQVKLGTLSDGSIVRPDSVAFVIKNDGKTGIGLINPQGILDINGKMYVKNIQTLYNAGAIDNAKFAGSLFIGDGGQNLALSGSYYNTGIGYEALTNNTSGSHNTASGFRALTGNTTGRYNVGLGSNATRANISGEFNTGLGAGMLSSNQFGNNNTAVGYLAGRDINTASGSGNNTIVGAWSGTGLTSGLNNTILGANVNVAAGLNNTIILADGSGNKRFYVNSAGFAGIGTTDPKHKLVVSDGGNEGFEVSVGNPNDVIYMQNYDRAAGTYKPFRYDASMHLFESGNVGIGIGLSVPSEKLQVNGNILASGTITPSDKRFKKDIRPLQGALDKLQKVQGVTYFYKSEDFKDRNFNKDLQFGVIAQELETIFPEMVTTSSDGYKSVNYTELIPVLVESVKELKKENDMLKARIDKIDRQIGQLKR